MGPRAVLITFFPKQLGASYGGKLADRIRKAKASVGKPVGARVKVLVDKTGGAIHGGPNRILGLQANQLRINQRVRPGLLELQLGGRSHQPTPPRELSPSEFGDFLKRYLKDLGYQVTVQRVPQPAVRSGIDSQPVVLTFKKVR